jgi:phosphotriesterase-related protein
MAVARTVLGDIPAEELGITFSHEYLTFSWGSARRDLGELYDREAVTKRISDSLAAAKRDYNVNTLVASSTTEMGRDVDMYAEISRRTGVNIIASTGSYGQVNALSLYWTIETSDQVEWYLVREITEGVGKNKIKCGNITLSWAAHSPTIAEDNWTRAAARVSRQLAIPISFHCIYPEIPSQVQVQGVVPTVRPEIPRIADGVEVNPGIQMIDIMTSEGADPSNLKIDYHMSTKGHIEPLLQVLRRGVNMGFETLSVSEGELQMVVGTIGALITAGYADRLLLSPQTMGPGWIPKQPQWNRENWNQDHSYLHREVIPSMLKVGIRETDIEKMLVDNPKRFLSF